MTNRETDSLTKRRLELEIKKLERESSAKAEWVRPNSIAAIVGALAIAAGVATSIPYFVWKVEQANFEVARANAAKDDAEKATKDANERTMQAETELIEIEERIEQARMLLRDPIRLFVDGTNTRSFLQALALLNVAGIYNGSNDTIRIVLLREDGVSNEISEMDRKLVHSGGFHAFEGYRRYFTRVHQLNASEGTFRILIDEGIEYEWPGWSMAMLKGPVFWFDGTSIEPIVVNPSYEYPSRP